ncbi:D-alanine--D-alanine ligase [Aliikangiella maris]|uniref:D-alanine--D-alanine ligase n=2 Tax=Aliikangiella maris TaxID=3162458 RepID=A0ABV3MJ92_9GAMM
MTEQVLTMRQPEEYGKVAVVFGGSSAERAISLLSGSAVFEALTDAGVDCIKLDPAEQSLALLKSESVDRVFLALHGPNGEDGVIQGYLKTLDIPFTGSNVSSSAITMNKLYTKQIWQQSNLPTAGYRVVKRNPPFTEKEARMLFAKQGPVLFVKPANEGSSVGMSKVRTPEELVSAVSLAHQYDDIALVENFISGKEYTVAILGNRALPSICMQTPREFYDYIAKYESTTTQYFCPSGLSEEDELKIRHLALNAFDAVGCSGWGRVDFIREGDKGDFFLLEINTIPGMTKSSLVPKAAQAAGMNFQQLVLAILDTSFEMEE